nr:MFS transporter [Micromonospora provocatoris]
MLLPYRPVFGQPVLRRLLPGLATSALGDGLALVAVTWLALQLAPDGQRGTWTAFAVAAYTLPGAAGTVLLGRWLGGRSGAQLAGWDATVRAAALGAIPVAHLAGVLDVGLYVALLAVSSLLHPWGSAGRFTLVAELLPQRHHLAANALLGVFGQAATIVGPPLAGLLIAWVGAVWVIAVDAASFAVLAASYRLVVRDRDAAAVRDRAAPAGAGPSRRSGFRIIARDRSLLGLLSLSFAFFFLFGPFYVAMPVHVTDDLRASAGTLAAYYTAFGVGSLLGGLLTGHLRGRPLRTTLAGVVALFGAALLPLGLGAPVVLSLPAFALAGLVWAPYQPTATRCSSAVPAPWTSPACWRPTGRSPCWRCRWARCSAVRRRHCSGRAPRSWRARWRSSPWGWSPRRPPHAPAPQPQNTERTGPADPHDQPGPRTTGPHDQHDQHDQPGPPARVDAPDRVRPGAP